MDQRARWIVDYGYKSAPAIKRRLDKAGVDPSRIRTVKDLERIPVLSKSELLELQRANPPFAEFLAVPIDTLKRVFVSPGPLQDVLGSLWDVRIASKAFFAA